MIKRSSEAVSPVASERSIFSIYDYDELMENLDREHWENRKQFFLTTLTFCLNIGNIFRLPKVVIEGNCKNFFIVYIITAFVVGNSLLAFEVCLGQCSVQRFLRVFWQCPFMEGIPYSMALISMLTAAYYSVINVYSYMYIFPSLTTDLLVYSYCSNSALKCNGSSPHLSDAPEMVYHKNQVVYFFDGKKVENGLNWRNIGLLFSMWALMCVVTIKGIRRIKWPFILGGPIICIIMVLIFAISFTCHGASYGVKELFTPHGMMPFQTKHWIQIIVQLTMAYGVGMGPLIIHGSCSKFHSPAHIDCLLILVITIIVSFFNVMTAYIGLGAKAMQANSTVDVILKDMTESGDGVMTHVLFTSLFSMMPRGLGHACSFLFFIAILLSGFLSLIWLIEVVALAVYQVTKVTEPNKKYANMVVCTFCVLLGLIVTIAGGDDIPYNLQVTIGVMCLLPVVLCELLAIIYCYGVFRFEDSISFMLGFEPGMIYVVLWCVTPIIYIVTFSLALFNIKGQMMTLQQILIVVTTTVIVLSPIPVFAIYNTRMYCKKGKCIQVLKAPPNIGDSVITLGEISSGINTPKRRVIFQEDSPNESLLQVEDLRNP